MTVGASVSDSCAAPYEMSAICPFLKQLSSKGSAGLPTALVSDGLAAATSRCPHLAGSTVSPLQVLAGLNKTPAAAVEAAAAPHGGNCPRELRGAERTGTLAHGAGMAAGGARGSVRQGRLKGSESSRRGVPLVCRLRRALCVSFVVYVCCHGGSVPLRLTLSFLRFPPPLFSAQLRGVQCAPRAPRRRPRPSRRRPAVS